MKNFNPTYDDLEIGARVYLKRRLGHYNWCYVENKNPPKFIKVRTDNHKDTKVKRAWVELADIKYVIVDDVEYYVYENDIEEDHIESNLTLFVDACPNSQPDQSN